MPFRGRWLLEKRGKKPQSVTVAGLVLYYCGLAVLGSTTSLAVWVASGATSRPLFWASAPASDELEPVDKSEISSLPFYWDPSPQTRSTPLRTTEVRLASWVQRMVALLDVAQPLGQVAPRGMPRP